MLKNQLNSTQKTTPDRVKSTREKLVRKIKATLKVATPEEILEVWILMKRQELQRTTIGLSEEQMNSIVQTLILELGYDTIAFSRTLPSPLMSQQPAATTDKSVEDVEEGWNLEEDADEDVEDSHHKDSYFNDDESDFDEEEDDLEEFAEDSQYQTSSRKQPVPILKKIEHSRTVTRNGRRS